MNILSESDLDTMVNAYVTCALWSETAYIRWDDDSARFVPDDSEDHSFLDQNFDADDIDASSLAEMRADCERFAEENAEDLSTVDPAQAGHDLWLTRNHHGAGFWDRGLGDIGQRLTDAAHAYGETSLYLGDDGEVYVQ